MTTPPYVDPVEPQTFSRAPSSERRAEAAGPMSQAQEINERRARVEDAEQLRNLRSL